MRILLIDDHTWVHQSVTDLVAQAHDIQLVGQGTDGSQAMALCKHHQPNIVLMDIVMPKTNGIIATRHLADTLPDIRVLAMSSFQDERSVLDMLNAGAVGYILKSELALQLVPTLRAVASGGTVLSSPVAAVLTRDSNGSSSKVTRDDFRLTEREIEVLESLASGKTNSEVALALSISAATVRYHITNITEKLGVDTRTEAIVLAVRHQII
ncbi:MAG: response regulator transcription factor [Chloroflexota bacterium]